LTTRDLHLPSLHDVLYHTSVTTADIPFSRVKATELD